MLYSRRGKAVGLQKQKDGKISGYVFDPEKKAPVLTVSHMKLPIYK